MKRIKILVVAICVTFSAFADSYGIIYTPNGSTIMVTYRDEHNADYIYNLTESVKADYPNAICRGSASNRYNSHSYAWHMQNNYELNRECWLNNSDVPTYWEDCSYIQTTSDEATVIYYPIAEHSAIKSWINRSWYMSKWGDGPLMEHAPEYVPFGSNVQRCYYKRNETPTPDSEPDTPVEPEEPEDIVGVLMPGSGDYLRNREYEFFPNESEEFEMDERYIYVWTIYEEQDDGADAVALGKATLECDEFPHIAKITFLTRGLFTVTVEVYNGDEELLRVFTCQPYVI